jgi:hypothetical protein
MSCYGRSKVKSLRVRKGKIGLTLGNLNNSVYLSGLVNGAGKMGLPLKTPMIPRV